MGQYKQRNNATKFLNFPNKFITFMPCFAKETRNTLTRKEEDLWKKKKTSHASVSVTLFHAD